MLADAMWAEPKRAPLPSRPASAGGDQRLGDERSPPSACARAFHQQVSMAFTLWQNGGLRSMLCMDIAPVPDDPAVEELARSILRVVPALHAGAVSHRAIRRRRCQNSKSSRSASVANVPPTRDAGTLDPRSGQSKSSPTSNEALSASPRPLSSRCSRSSWCRSAASLSVRSKSIRGCTRRCAAHDRAVPCEPDEGSGGYSDQPNVFYVGAVNGGVWKTNDYGRTWNPFSRRSAEWIDRRRSRWRRRIQT